MDVSHVNYAQVDGPARVAVHSDEGWGKTTLLCHFPKPLVVGAENGVPRDIGFSVPVIRPQSWLDLFDLVGSLTTDRHDYKTVGFDTVDWIEPLIYRFVLDRDSKRQTEVNPKGRLLESIEDYGYGKGYLVAEEEFRKLITALDVLQAKRGMHVVMLMHSKVRTFKNPSGPDYDRWEPKCHDRIARVIVEWAENVLFGFFEINASKVPEDKERHKMSPDKARAKGFGGGVRLIGTQKNALYDAKNRVKLPPQIEFNDPTELIPLLLGEHLDRVAPPPMERRDPPPSRQYEAVINGSAAQPPPEYAPGQYETTMGRAPTPRDYGDPEPPRQAPVIERKTAPAAPPAPAPSNVGAHHADRQADEQRRQDDAFAKARQAAIDAEASKHEARPPIQPQEPKTQRDAEYAIMKGLTEAITNAGKLGDVYRKRVEGWVTKANGDLPKIEAIVGRVNEDLAAAPQQAQR